MGAGRKPKPAGEKQRKAVTIYLTDAEHQDLEEVAGEESLAGFVRRVLLRSLARRRR